MATFEEVQPWGTTTYQVIPGTHITFNTKRQKVDLITNPCFGRMLFLDGVLQSATADEAIYHRALVRPWSSLGVGTEPQTALILGGAEGAAAREVFRSYPSVKRLTMVDWDAELVHWMRQREAGDAERASFADQRLTVVAEDVSIFLSADSSLFDVIFVDLLDPDTESWEWLVRILVKAIARLSPGGFLTVNLGSDKKIAQTLISLLRRICQMMVITPYCIFVPSFQEPWFLAYVTQEPVEMWSPLNQTHDAAIHALPMEWA